jgi:uncharacterized LabA/DUF88 family protein
MEGSNFYHTIRDLNLHVDYRRLLGYFSTQGTLVKATYYTTLLQDQTPDWLMRLLTWLTYNGYSVVTKQAKYVRRQVTSDSGENCWTNEVKGDLDIELAVDALTLAPYCDTIFLFSGDGNFVPLIKALQQHGCRVIVVSSEKTRESSVADEMRRQADQFIDLATIADDIRRVDRDDG